MVSDSILYRKVGVDDKIRADSAVFRPAAQGGWVHPSCTEPMAPRRKRKKAAKPEASCLDGSEAALCIAGAARTFSTHLVLDSLRAAVVGSLGSVRLFLHLKATDSSRRGDFCGDRRGCAAFSQHNETTLDSILTALRVRC